MITFLGKEFIAYDVVGGLSRYTHVPTYQECVQTSDMSEATWRAEKQKFFRKYKALEIYNRPMGFTPKKDQVIDSVQNLLRQIAREELFASS